MADLSVLIPARNEVFLQKTIESVLSAAEGDTEIIAVCDGYWPTPPIQDHPKVTVIHHTESIGQRAAINEAARLSQAKYILKTDAHSMFDQGFDVKLMANCEPDWTVIPRMFNLDAFKWVCKLCGRETGQGPQPKNCGCGQSGWDMVYTWQPKHHKKTDYMYIDSDMRAQYWQRYRKRPQAAGAIVDVMTGQGACWFQERDRFWQLGGMDEQHGGWGQVGIEVACKAWLSGGRLVVNKNTWFSHLFRTQPGFQFPYPIRNADVEHARRYSRDLWLQNKWPQQTRQLQWLIDKFAPVPSWNGQAKKVTSDLTILYYTANKVDARLGQYVREKLRETVGDVPIISVSQEPMKFGKNICVGQIGQSLQNVYRQVLEGAKAATTEYVALCEDDCLYMPDHFNHRPSGRAFAYNLARWCLHTDGPEICYTYRKRPILSQCIAPRDLLIEALEQRQPLDKVPDKFCGEPGLFEKQLGLPEFAHETFMTAAPNLVVCHKANTMGRKLQGEDKRQDLPFWGDAGQLTETMFRSQQEQTMPQFNRSAKRRSQHSYIGSIIFTMDELMANILEYRDRRRPLERAVRRMETQPLFIRKILAGEEFDDEALVAEPYYTCLRDTHLTGHSKSLRLMRDMIRLCLDIKENGVRAPIDMWRVGSRLVLHRGWRRVLIMKELGYKEVAARVFKSKEIFQIFNPSADWAPGKHETDTIHGIAINQFVKLGHKATDKYWVHDYTRLYDRHLHHLRGKAIKILEIGVLRGASLLLWKHAFPRAKVFGIEKRQTVWKPWLAGQKRIKVFVGRQEDREFLEDQVIPAGPFDVIIDDASHWPHQQLATFNHLWPHVTPGGIFAIEDLHGNYMKRRAPKGPLMIDELKKTIDAVCGTDTRLDVRSMSLYYNIAFIEKNRT